MKAWRPSRSRPSVGDMSYSAPVHMPVQRADRTDRFSHRGCSAAQERYLPVGSSWSIIRPFLHHYSRRVAGDIGKAPIFLTGTVEAGSLQKYRLVYSPVDNVLTMNIICIKANRPPPSLLALFWSAILIAFDAETRKMIPKQPMVLFMLDPLLQVPTSPR
jgi:hypothetical protein